MSAPKAGTPTVENLLRAAAARLRAGHVAEPETDARLLLAEAMAEPRLSLALHGDKPVPPEAAARFAELVSRRATGTPVGRILGLREFWGLTFRLSPETLEPRPDSEALIEAALAALGQKRHAPLTILDLGTGSGCLLLALMSECLQARGIGVDVSTGALRMARANAAAAGLGGRCLWVASNWGAALTLKADIILSNPPYIPTGDMAGLAREVRAHDPARALDGGTDGLDAYRHLAAALPGLLAPDGVAVIELGKGQQADVSALMQRAGLEVADCRSDLGGVARALVLRRADNHG